VAVPGRAFAGSESARTGISGLTIADDVTMVMVPDLVTAATKDDGTIDLGMWKSVQLALINHCEGQANRMAVLDAPPGMSPQQIKEWRSDTAMYDSAFAALYYPWIEVANPAATNGDTEIMVPPSGHLAGIWARTDDTRGVWKAPANEVVRGALNVETQHHQGRAGPAQPDRHQLHPPVRHPGHPGVGRSHTVVEHRLDLHQRAATVQHDRDDDHERHVSSPCSSRTTRSCGRASSAPSVRSSVGCGATARCSAPPPSRRSTSSATTRRTRPTRRSIQGRVRDLPVVKSRSASPPSGEARRVRRDLPGSSRRSSRSRTVQPGHGQVPDGHPEACFKAWPSKWSVSDLDAGSDDVMTEEIELQIEFLERAK
jgi:hypothetical protein